MADERSGLLREPFRVSDRCPRLWGAEETVEIHLEIAILCALRKAILLENVGALLSCQRKTRATLAYIFQDHSFW